MRLRKNALFVAAASVLIGGLAIAAQQMQQMPMKPLPPKVDKQLSAARKDLNSVKTQLPELGCCNDPACNYCPLISGKCPCGMNVTTDMGVCGECKLGWEAGHGRVANVKPEQVKTIHGDMLMMMEKMREMNFPKGQKQQGQTAPVKSGQ